jgi:outer membrane protein OmpA-like peptidoglycan-associated protein
VAEAALSDLARRLAADPALRVIITAYAHEGVADASQARRLSLFRALSVRNFLREADIRSARIEIRAVGDKDDGPPRDRVDIVLP